MGITLQDAWTSAAVVLGLQMAALSWRLSRELVVGERRDDAKSTGACRRDATGRAGEENEMSEPDLTWLPPCDILNLLSSVVMVVGVFVLPLLGFVGERFALVAFGLSLVLFLGFAIALPAHYGLYNPRTSRRMLYFPLQEKLAVVIATIGVAAYLVLAIF